MSPTQTRRAFLRKSTIATSGLLIARSASAAVSPNDKINVAMIGTANQAAYNLNEVFKTGLANIVALCDVDDKLLAAAAEKHPKAKTYNDFRRLIDQKDIDAIVVAIPDHAHAVATSAVLHSGRHAYCEKPLTHTISEARFITELAARQKLVTQIGTQIHAGSNYRRVVELVKSTAIGPVKEVHVWVNATYGGKDMPNARIAVPENLHYDLWLGPVKADIPYNPEWVPFKWRNWWGFGGGALADFGCHYLDLPHWALDLRHPNSAEAEGPPIHHDSTPPWLIVRYEYPARGAQPPVNLTWYHGGKFPVALITPDQHEKWRSGVLFVGEKGSLLADYNRHVLLPEKDFSGFEPPKPFIPDSIGHHREWVEAIRNKGSTTCSFDYSGPLTEAALLGNVAYRTGKKIEWDFKGMLAKNSKNAEQFIHHDYRSGWKL